jgi:hypothetical protein
MARNAVVFRVLIASPEDVKDKGDVLAEVISEWNATHSRSAGIIFEPIRWDTHAYPAVGDHPQTILNRQIVDDADIAVGIFWSRMGTPTPMASSGTVEEIERLRDAGKRVLLYFSKASIPQDHDPQQFKLLKEYKEKLTDAALYWEFASCEELRKLAAQHLAKLANEIAQGLTKAAGSEVKHTANLVSLKPFPTRVSRDNTDTWREKEDGNPAAVAAFRNDPSRGVTVESVVGLRAQISFYTPRGEEVRRVNTGCWLGDPYNHTSLSVGSTLQLIIALDMGITEEPCTIENTRAKSVDFGREGTLFRSLGRQQYNVKVRLIGKIKSQGDLVADFHFTLDLRREPLLKPD